MGLFSNSKSKEPKPIGEVTHYYGGLGVAIVKFNRAVKAGEKVQFKGTTTDFKETIQSLQRDHKEVESAKRNQEIGIKVNSKVRDGDKVYAVE